MRKARASKCFVCPPSTCHCGTHLRTRHSGISYVNSGGRRLSFHFPLHVNLALGSIIEKAGPCYSLGSSSRSFTWLSGLNKLHDFSKPQFPHLYDGSLHSYLPFLMEITVRLWREGRKCRGQVRNEQPQEQQVKGKCEVSKCKLCLIQIFLASFWNA